MGSAVRHIVIVGGGTAGWLAASLIAAQRKLEASGAISVTLIESPEIPSVGVGEGTWPTMRKTLQRIGLSEAAFIVECDASFKQGSRFDGWVSGTAGDSYLHPFAPPVAGAADDIVAAWRGQPDAGPFACAVSPQHRICELGLAPKQPSMPDFGGALNYGYHLDAVKLAAMLARHATSVLGVRHIRDHVVGFESADNGDVSAVATKQNGAVTG
ncbi:MAG: tryptophan 7-halogenase, partial [Polymorphobacter sp.]